MKLLLKLFAPIYLAADYDRVGYQAFSVVVTIVYLTILILRYKSPQYFNQ